MSKDSILVPAAASALAILLIILYPTPSVGQSAVVLAVDPREYPLDEVVLSVSAPWGDHISVRIVTAPTGAYAEKYISSIRFRENSGPAAKSTGAAIPPEVRGVLLNDATIKMARIDSRKTLYFVEIPFGKPVSCPPGESPEQFPRQTALASFDGATITWSIYQPC